MKKYGVKRDYNRFHCNNFTQKPMQKIVEKTVGGECGVKGVIDAYVQYKP